MSTEQHRTLQSAIDYIAQLERRLAQAQREGNAEEIDRLIGDKSRAMLELGIIQTEVQTSVMAKNLGALLQMLEEQNERRTTDMAAIGNALGVLQSGANQMQAEFREVGETLSQIGGDVEQNTRDIDRHETMIRGILDHLATHDRRLDQIDAQLIALGAQLQSDIQRMREIGE